MAHPKENFPEAKAGQRLSKEYWGVRKGSFVKRAILKGQNGLSKLSDVKGTKPKGTTVPVRDKMSLTINSNILGC